jgi:hypothetical protein
MYCTYITFYRGNQLPPFYIGYTTTKNISRGYSGSVSSRRYKSIWKQEREDNPHLFRTVVLRTFNTREEALEHEDRLLRGLLVHKNDLYINMHIAGKYFTPGPLYMTPEELSARAKKGAQSQTPEQHSARTKKAQQSMTFEERSAARKLAWERATPEERIARIKKMKGAVTPEDRSARAKKAWETRRSLLDHEQQDDGR